MLCSSTCKLGLFALGAAHGMQFADFFLEGRSAEAIGFLGLLIGRFNEILQVDPKSKGQQSGGRSEDLFVTVKLSPGFGKHAFP